MLALSLLGPFAARSEERPLTQLNSQKAQALLIYLAVEARQVHQRESLMALLWPDYPLKSAQQSLRQIVYLLRQALEPEESNLILAERFTVGLNQDAFSLDVAQFEQLSGNGRSPQEWQQAADLYRDHFLTDFYLPDSEPFEEWAAGKRAFYQRQMQELLQRLVAHYLEIGDDAAVETAVRRQLELDNLQETAHRQLIEILARNGRRQEALTHYRTLQQILQDELAIEPDSETRELIERIRTGEAVEKTKAGQSSTPNKKPLPRNNLPHLLTSFVGREQEIAEIIDLLTNDRLVMLTGVGGIGKTTLSIQAGHQALAQFPDGVWLIELAPLANPDRVAQTAVYALGLRESANQSAVDTLLNFLQEKTTLLILDNCEHLLQSTAQLAQTLLQSCPYLKILANSREPLAIPGEIIYPVSPLSFPDDGRTSLAKWSGYHALRLFVDRATAVLPQFQVTENNLAPLIQICQQLDGIPLAIELAAAREKLLTTQQIADGLQDRFRLLTNSNRLTVPRHQTLHALVDWSWELLSEQEQILLRRLSVFAGSISLAAVQAVCTDDNIASADILDLLSQLANKSLIIAERKQGQQTRYRLLETIRQYGQEQLSAANETEPFRQRHLTYFCQLAEQAEPELVGPDQVNWLKKLEKDLDNMRTALTWAQQGDIEAGLRLAAALWQFWNVQGYAPEGEAWLAQLLAQAEHVNPSIKAKALGVQSDLNRHISNFNLAYTIAEECLSLYRELKDPDGIAFGLLCLAHAILDIAPPRRYEIIEELMAECLAIYRASGNRLGEANALLLLGTVVGNFKANYESGIVYLEECLSIYRELGHLWTICSILIQMGWLAFLQGDFETARFWWTREPELSELFGNRSRAGISTLVGWGELYLREGKYEEARRCFEQYILLSQQTGEKHGEYWGYVRLGYAFLRMGELDQAQQLFIKSQQHFVEIGMFDGVAYALEGMFSLAVIQKKPERAVTLLAQADAAREKAQDFRPPVEQADVDKDIALIREMIDEETYAAAYAAGQAMTMEEAIALALAGS